MLVARRRRRHGPEEKSRRGCRFWVRVVAAVENSACEFFVSTLLTRARFRSWVLLGNVSLAFSAPRSYLWCETIESRQAMHLMIRARDSMQFFRTTHLYDSSSSMYSSCAYCACTLMFFCAHTRVHHTRMHVVCVRVICTMQCEWANWQRCWKQVTPLFNCTSL